MPKTLADINRENRKKWNQSVDALSPWKEPELVKFLQKKYFAVSTLQELIRAAKNEYPEADLSVITKYAEQTFKLAKEMGYDAVTLQKGWGYWDLTRYPYGGDFKRLTENTQAEIIGPGAKGDEIKVKFSNGTIAVIKKAAIQEDE